MTKRTIRLSDEQKHAVLAFSRHVGRSPTWVIKNALRGFSGTPGPICSNSPNPRLNRACSIRLDARTARALTATANRCKTRVSDVIRCALSAYLATQKQVAISHMSYTATQPALQKPHGSVRELKWQGSQTSHTATQKRVALPYTRLHRHTHTPSPPRGKTNTNSLPIPNKDKKYIYILRAYARGTRPVAGCRRRVGGSVPSRNPLRRAERARKSVSRVDYVPTPGQLEDASRVALRASEIMWGKDLHPSRARELARQWIIPLRARGYDVDQILGVVRYCASWMPRPHFAGVLGRRFKDWLDAVGNPGVNGGSTRDDSGKTVDNPKDTDSGDSADSQDNQDNLDNRDNRDSGDSGEPVSELEAQAYAKRIQEMIAGIARPQLSEVDESEARDRLEAKRAELARKYGRE